MKEPRDVIQPRSGVFALRKRAERIGWTCQDADEAIKRAVKECHVAERDQRRVSMQREA